jgi:hypothetical protein
MATIRTKPPVFSGSTLDITLKALVPVEGPVLADPMVFADAGAELLLKSNDKTTLEKSGLSAPDGAT